MDFYGRARSPQDSAFGQRRFDPTDRSNPSGRSVVGESSLVLRLFEREREDLQKRATKTQQDVLAQVSKRMEDFDLRLAASLKNATDMLQRGVKGGVNGTDSESITAVLGRLEGRLGLHGRAIASMCADMTQHLGLDLNVMHLLSPTSNEATPGKRVMFKRDSEYPEEPVNSTAAARDRLKEIMQATKQVSFPDEKGGPEGMRRADLDAQIATLLSPLADRLSALEAHVKGAAGHPPAGDAPRRTNGLDEVAERGTKGLDEIAEKMDEKLQNLAVKVNELEASHASMLSGEMCSNAMTVGQVDAKMQQFEGKIAELVDVKLAPLGRKLQNLSEDLIEIRLSATTNRAAAGPETSKPPPMPTAVGVQPDELDRRLSRERQEIEAAMRDQLERLLVTVRDEISGTVSSSLSDLQGCIQDLQAKVEKLGRRSSSVASGHRAEAEDGQGGSDVQKVASSKRMPRDEVEDLLNSQAISSREYVDGEVALLQRDISELKRQIASSSPGIPREEVESLIAGVCSELKLELASCRKHTDGEVARLNEEMKQAAHRNAEVRQTPVHDNLAVPGQDEKRQRPHISLTIPGPDSSYGSSHVTVQTPAFGSHLGAAETDRSPAGTDRSHRSAGNSARRHSMQLMRVSGGSARRRSKSPRVLAVIPAPQHDSEFQRIMTLAFEMQNHRPAVTYDDAPPTETRKSSKRPSSCPPPPLVDHEEDVEQLSEDALRLRVSQRLFIRLIRRALFGAIDGYPAEDEIAIADAAGQPESPKRRLTRQQLDQLAGAGDHDGKETLPNEVPFSKAISEASSGSF